MRYIHSIWKIKDLGNEHCIDTDFNFYMFLLSALLIKKHGHTIELYCDKESYKLYSLIPYDKIHVIDFNEEGINDKLWTWGKIKVHLLQTEPYVLIDGDVFMFRDIIGDREFKVVVQQEENIDTITKGAFEWAYRSTIKNAFNKNNYGIKWGKYYGYAYNCGVIGFTDMKIKNEYANKVKTIFKAVTKNKKLNEWAKTDSSIIFTTEQAYLYYFLHEKKISPLEILPLTEMAKYNYNRYDVLNTIPDKVGFCHMWGNTKINNTKMIEGIKYKIKTHFSEYNSIVVDYENFNLKHKIYASIN